MLYVLSLGCTHQYFQRYLFILSEHSIKYLGSYFVFSRLLTKNSRSFMYKYILSLFVCGLIWLSSAFDFPDPESPILSVLYKWSGIYSHLGLNVLVFSPVTSSKLIIFKWKYFLPILPIFKITILLVSYSSRPK